MPPSLAVPAGVSRGCQGGRTWHQHKGRDKWCQIDIQENVGNSGTISSLLFCSASKMHIIKFVSFQRVECTYVGSERQQRTRTIAPRGRDQSEARLDCLRSSARNTFP